MAKDLVQVGQNVQASVQGTTLTLVIDLSQNLGPSKSGKSNGVATTNGNVPIPGAPNGLRLGLNAYIPR